MPGGLCVRDLSYAYGAKPALDGVSFDLAEGRFCALLGPNGAGKSTLFALLTRLFVARRGRIEVAGFELGRAPRLALARMGVVFQQPTLDLDLTVRRNLAYFAALHGMSGRAVEARIDAALDRLDMRARAGERARDLNWRAPAAGGDRAGADPRSGRAAARRAYGGARRGEPGGDHRACPRARGRAGADGAVGHASGGRGGPGDRLLVLHRGRIVADGTAGEIAGGAAVGGAVPGDDAGGRVRGRRAPGAASSLTDAARRHVSARGQTIKSLIYKVSSAAVYLISTLVNDRPRSRSAESRLCPEHGGARRSEGTGRNSWATLLQALHGAAP
jgi:ABC-2 type transport system ATP-binding protein